MKAEIFSAEMAAPLIKPQAARAAMLARTPAIVGAPPARAKAPVTPASAIIEPTERSIPPETITIVMPIAMIMITAVWRATLARLPDERNLGSSTAMITHNAIRLAKGMKRLIQSDIDLVGVPPPGGHCFLITPPKGGTQNNPHSKNYAAWCSPSSTAA